MESPSTSTSTNKKKNALHFILDDLSNPLIAQFLQQHLDDMHRISPPESVHALDLSGLKKPEIRFWSVWDQGELVGSGALKQLSHTHGELKSMRTDADRRGQGLGKAILTFLINHAKEAGYTRLSLETGSMDFFIPARRLYQSFGFTECPPFADYKPDPNSVFMLMDLST